MNPFYEKYPRYVEVDEERFQIKTDFRQIIQVSDVLADDLPVETKAGYILSLYVERLPSDLVKAIKAIENFITGYSDRMDEIEEEEEEEEKEAPEKKRKKVLSYDQDAPYIIADFMRFYSMDLMEIKYLHWYKFQLLMTGLPEDSMIKTRIMYRHMNLSTIKNKDERKRIARIQRQIAIKEKAPDDYEIGAIFGGMND